jgi:hypothetical protein
MQYFSRNLSNQRGFPGIPCFPLLLHPGIYVSYRFPAGNGYEFPLPIPFKSCPVAVDQWVIFSSMSFRIVENRKGKRGQTRMSKMGGKRWKMFVSFYCEPDTTSE